MTDHPPVTPAQPGSTSAGTPAVRLAEETIGQLHARLAEVTAERDKARADVRQLVDRCAAAETALTDLSETEGVLWSRIHEAEAALERVRACLLMGGQSAAFRAKTALAALPTPTDRSDPIADEDVSAALPDRGVAAPLDERVDTSGEG